eukprot:TRINITY_DN19330_c0_g1_i3.p1 TRINITY_DN19330_c0_g1~~TRINITY_DN19330_c0_g1_i3.p1  ORF type:complete len:295 (+),score=39.05 TRINITY_DN19330_c0_g1_i3:391-1275(+)
MLQGQVCRQLYCKPQGRNCRAMSVVSVSTNKSVSQAFQELRDQKKSGFIPFICAGDPSLDATAKALIALDEAGSSLIELGVPYSDPLADGPTIQGAHQRGLNNKVTLDDVIDVLKQVTPKVSAPIVLFTYFNPIMARGPDIFCQQIKEAGAAGLLVPDIPLEETGIIRQSTEKFGLELVLLVTPQTPVERAKAIAMASQGFIYIVSVTGVTGERAKVSEDLESKINIVRSVSDKPIAVGFGVSKQEHVREIRQLGAEGIIVGSALVKALNSSENQDEGLRNMRALAEDLIQGLV